MTEFFDSCFPPIYIKPTGYTRYWSFSCGEYTATYPTGIRIANWQKLSYNILCYSSEWITHSLRWLSTLFTYFLQYTTTGRMCAYRKMHQEYLFHILDIACKNQLSLLQNTYAGSLTSFVIFLTDLFHLFLLYFKKDPCSKNVDELLILHFDAFLRTIPYHLSF